MDPWLKGCLLLLCLYGPCVQANSDKDGDGVPDFKDACPGTPAGSKVGANGCAVQPSFSSPLCLMTSDNQPFPADCNHAEIPSVYFEFGSAFVPFEDAAMLARLADSVREQKVSLLLKGHTDIIGKDDVNRRLSLARAENVAAVLSGDFGIERVRIRLESCGDSEPVASNETEYGRQQNRRVDILIIVE